MKVIVTESIADDGIDQLKKAGYEVTYEAGIDRDKLLDIIGDYDALIVRSTTQVNEELLERASNLKAVGRAGNGIDNIDLDACTNRGIVVVNTPEGNSMAAAELAITHIYNTFRNYTAAVIAGKNHDFRRGSFVGNELEGKVLGIIGLGRIGSIVARKMQGAGMKVIAYDPYIPDTRFEELGVKKCSVLEDLLSQADAITIHTPKTDETINILSEKELALCKDGVRIVNAARGGLVNEKALYDALKSGKVKFAGLDVLDPEPNYNRDPSVQDYYNPLLELDNIAITPHLGASTKEASINCGTQVCEYVMASLKGETVPAVNLPCTGDYDIEKLRPYISLAESLGGVYYQMSKTPVTTITVTYSGEITKEDTGIITLSVIKGFLTPVCETNVNYVNAGLLLKSKGIDIVERKVDRSDKYNSLISVTFSTEDKNYCISGTVYGKSQIRIIDYLGFNMDFEPAKNVIAILNEDVPGVIGKMGTLLGEHGVNITAMQCSSNKTKGHAESFFSIDSPAPAKLKELIQEIPEILKVSFLHF